MLRCLGTRLRPLTDDRPKALVELEVKPLLEHVILKMRRSRGGAEWW
ncbi:MAG: sugar phosphate nucleotidyltransferase [Odoribacter sp.]